jgi:5-carboxyvanillate decarboxylase
MTIEGATGGLRIGGQHGYLRIATEEAFCPPEMLPMYLEAFDKEDVDPGFKGLMGFYMSSNAERPRFIMERLQDLGDLRLEDMDARGIDKQVIALTSPGTQFLSADRGSRLSEIANDQLAEACRRHPDRFVGMAACAPQAPEHAAREIERAVQRLGMRAVIINSHTDGEYLDNPKFYPVLEAAEALDVPIYLHPNSPSRGLIEPMQEAGLDGAIFGFGVETGLHALRMITRGLFDRFPRLQVILGHMGEALPFWLYRLDYMHAATVKAKRYETMGPLKKKVSDYLRDNFHITNSGVAWEPAIKFTQEQLGVDRVLYAMDYPYQAPPEEVAILDAMDMPFEAKKKFFQTNAERLFKL